jgi:hypothetical protein
MTALAQSRHVGYLVRLSSPSAGPVAQELRQVVVDAIGTLKTGVGARASMVFNDLNALAKESAIDVKESATMLLAQQFLLAMPSSMPAPELALDSDGDVVFDWVGSGGRMLTVALRGDGTLSYAGRLSLGDREHGTKRFVDAIPSQVLDLAHRVTRP